MKSTMAAFSHYLTILTLAGTVLVGSTNSLTSGVQFPDPRCECIDTHSTDLLDWRSVDGVSSDSPTSGRTCTTSGHAQCERNCLRLGYPLYGRDGRGQCICAWSFRHRQGNSNNSSANASSSECSRCVSSATHKLSLQCLCGKPSSSLWICSSSHSASVASNVMYLGCYRYTKERLHTPSTKTVLLNSSDIAIRTHYFAPHVLHSPAMCAAYCAKYGNGHTLAGIGNYYHCLCGKGLDGNYKQKEISKCPRCSGDGRLRCGKSNTIAVYQSLTVRVTSWRNSSQFEEDESVMPGENIILRCDSGLAVNVSYGWSCVDYNTPNATGDTLNVTMPAHRRYFTCTCNVLVQQSQGLDTFAQSSIHILVQKVMPRKITAMLSDKVSLECNAFHCPGGRIAWLQLPRGGLNAIPVWPGVEKVSLVATNALNGSEMECICQHNSTCLARFTINVVDFNGSISILEGTSKSVVAGESARLHCMATTSESFAMRWYREGQTFNVVAYQHGVGQRVLPLKLSNVGQSASGTYVCEARRNNVTAMHTRTIVQVVGLKVVTTTGGTHPSLPPGTSGSSEVIYLILVAILSIAVISLIFTILVPKLFSLRRERRTRVKLDDSCTPDCDGNATARRTNGDSDGLSLSLTSRTSFQQYAPTPDPMSDVMSSPPIAQAYFCDSSNASHCGGMEESPAQYDRVSKDSSFCISPLPSSIMVQIDMLEGGSLPHTYSSVPVDSGSDSNSRTHAGFMCSTSSSSSYSTDNEYDHLRKKRKEIYSKPYQPPPDSEMAVYSHLKHRGYRKINRTNVEVGGEIGSGHFGVVRSGWWVEEQSGRRVPVAVKAMQEDLTPEKRVEFLKEAAIMGQFKHRNIVFLYGVVTTSHAKEVMLVLELLDPKNLREYLVGLTGNGVSRMLGEQLLRFSGEVAEGMAYLAHRSFVHRDLAARNVLRGIDGTCKISDFGLSCEIKDAKLYVSRGRLIPIRWTAPEALTMNKFSTSSDVWSYGILLYEIWSLGKRPYHLWCNDKVISEVKNGYRLPKPRYCPDDVFEIMTDCWNSNRHHRPTFRTIVPQLTITNMNRVSWATDGHGCDNAVETTSAATAL